MDTKTWENQVNLWKQRRKELGVTFEELAERTNISIRQLYYLFGGKAKNPGVATVHRVNQALGLTEDKEQPLSNEEKQLVSLIAQLTDEEVKELSNFVDYIISKREK